MEPITEERLAEIVGAGTNCFKICVPSEGEQMARELQQRRLSDRWIPVEEKLPELNQPCLLWHPSFGVIYGGFDADGEFCGNYGGKFQPETLPYNNPTHWRPLPPAPERTEP